TEYPIPTLASQPIGIVTGPDGFIWFTEYQGNKIGRINVTASATLAAAVLPASRSVLVNTPASAFATIINLGPGTATSCLLSPKTVIPASFTYQPTDPTTNALIGTSNTPVDIPAGVAQSFVIAFTPTSPFPPTDVALNFTCDNAGPAPSTSNLNTLLLSAS